MGLFVVSSKFFVLQLGFWLFVLISGKREDGIEHFGEVSEHAIASEVLEQGSGTDVSGTGR